MTIPAAATSVLLTVKVTHKHTHILTHSTHNAQAVSTGSGQSISFGSLTSTDVAFAGNPGPASIPVSVFLAGSLNVLVTPNVLTLIF